MSTEKIKRLIRETGQLRKELAEKDIEEGSLPVELTNRDLAAVVYALAYTWIAEYAMGQEGYRLILDMLGDASATILSADTAPLVDEAINQILGGKQNPEEGSDGA